MKRYRVVVSGSWMSGARWQIGLYRWRFIAVIDAWWWVVRNPQGEAEVQERIRPVLPVARVL